MLYISRSLNVCDADEKTKKTQYMYMYISYPIRPNIPLCIEVNVEYLIN